MSKIVILLCIVVVASTDAYIKDQFEVVEDRIKFVIYNGLRALSTKFNSMMQVIRENIAKVQADHISKVENISAEIGDIERKAWDVIRNLKVNTSLKCNFVENLGGYDCTKSIRETLDNSWKSFLHVTRPLSCSDAAKDAVDNSEIVSETKKQYQRARSDLINLWKQPLCSSLYDKTTDFDRITWCNEILYIQINDKINNKHPLVLAKIEDTKEKIPTLLSSTSGCQSHWDKTAFQADVEESVRKAKECFKQCPLEEQLQTSTAAN